TRARTELSIDPNCDCFPCLSMRSPPGSVCRWVPLQLVCRASCHPPSTRRCRLDREVARVGSLGLVGPLPGRTRIPACLSSSTHRRTRRRNSPRRPAPPASQPSPPRPPLGRPPPPPHPPRH